MEVGQGFVGKKNVSMELEVEEEWVMAAKITRIYYKCM